MIGRILIGIGIALLGWLIVWKTAWFVNLLGSFDWAERNLGGGGTNLFYKLLGTAVIIIGFMVVTNLFESFVVGAIGGLFGSV